jgi:hypothetical protein
MGLRAAVIATSALWENRQLTGAHHRWQPATAGCHLIYHQEGVLPNQLTLVPHHGAKVKMDDQELT